MAALAGAGHSVTGVEPSAAMRARGAKRQATLPERVARRMRFVEGTATAPALMNGESFDVTLLGLGTFGHLTSAAERELALRQFHDLLKPGGLLIMDIDIAGPRRLLESVGQVWWLGSWRSDDGGIIAHSMVGALGEPPGTVEVTHLYDVHSQGGPVHRTLTSMTLALLSRGEIELAVRHAGFNDITIYGGYDLAPADDQSPRAIVTALR
jgi:SAM-dependent methyltransferase